MQWVLLAVIVVALLYMARFYPKVAFSILGLLAIGAATIVLTTTDVGFANRSKISNSEVKVENPVIAEAYGNSYRLNARLINTNKDRTLRDATISVTMLDCSNETDNNCQVIGQEDEHINIKIPPGQARDFSQSLSFGTAEAKGTLRWEIKIINTRT